MRKATILAITLLLPVVTLLAAPIKKDAAKATAAAFLQQQVSHSNGSKHAPQQLQLVSAEAENSAYYVFNNINGNGFAIVSGDDTAENPILGYSTEGNLSQENMPEALRAILSDYAEVVKFAQQNGLSMKQAPRKAGRANISPFVPFKWNQSGTAANNCPESTLSDDGKHMSTGCMAVTTGMIVAYYKYPETLPAAYNSNVDWNEQASNADWSPSYNYSSSYASSYTQPGDYPQFMRHICDLLNTSFSSSGSGAQASAFKPAMVKMGYDPAIRKIQRDAYSMEDWEDMIYAELAAKRPVYLYGDHSVLGGHSYLCDGYKDGLYNIHWGWGGTCDGYFDMGVLNPFISYFSGWSSLGYPCAPAGFTSGLSAYIGIQPKPEGEVEAAREFVTLDGMRIESNKTANATIFNYNEGSYVGSVCWVMLSGNDTFQVIEGTEKTINLSNYTNITQSISALNLTDGTHRITLACKKADEEWALCEGYKQKYLDITVNGGELAIVAHPIVNVTVENVEYFGTTGSGDDQYLEFIVTLKNNGDDVYENFSISGVRSDGKKVGGMSQNIGIKAGQTQTYSMFVDKGTGLNSLTDPTYTLTIKKKADVIWTGTVTAASNYTNYTKYDGVEFEDYEYKDSKAYLYSNVLKGTVNIKNENSYGSSYYVFNSPIRITLTDADKNIVAQTTEKLVLQKNELGKYAVNFENLQSGQKYYLTVEAMLSTRSGSTYTYKADKTYFTDFEITVQAGIVYVDDMGMEARQEVNEGEKVDLPANTAAVDFTKFSPEYINLSSITNPNCTYFFNDGEEAPAELSGKNVIIGNTAEKITLTDEGPVAFLKNFTATEATYTRQMTDDNWNTIVVPFAAKVKVEGEESDIDWFRKGEPNGRKFWLYKFNGSDPASVYFDAESAKVMSANTPYLIEVPGDQWGAKYQLSDKKLVFHGENVAFTTDAPEKKTNFYSFIGTYTKANTNGGYKLNEEGDFFELQNDDAYETPFHAYFMGDAVSNPGKQGLTLNLGDVPTLIMNVENERQDVENFFDLQGRRVQNAQKGIYILKGKKVVVK